MSWIKTLPSGPFQTNAYLLGADNSDTAVLIDSPPDCYDAVQAALMEEGRQLSAVLITHPHFDHTLDSFRFSEDGIRIFAHADAVADIEKPETLNLIPTPEGGFPGGRVTDEISGGDVFSLAGLDIEVLYVPGHSYGSLAFSIPDSGICFPGDVIFQGSIGRTDLPGGNFNVLSASIRSRIYSLNDEVVLYPGHGLATSVGREKSSNPFVRG